MEETGYSENSSSGAISVQQFISCLKERLLNKEEYSQRKHDHLKYTRKELSELSWNQYIFRIYKYNTLTVRCCGRPYLKEPMFCFVAVLALFTAVRIALWQPWHINSTWHYSI